MEWSGESLRFAAAAARVGCLANLIQISFSKLPVEIHFSSCQLPAGVANSERPLGKSCPSPSLHTDNHTVLIKGVVSMLLVDLGTTCFSSLVFSI